MKTQLLLETLQKKIQLVNHAVSGKTQLPILLTILITAKKGKITLSATDLEIGIVQEIEASVEEEGAVAVPAKLFSEIVGSLHAQKITLETKEKNLVLKGEKNTVSYQTQDETEFPVLYKEKGDIILNFEKNTIKESVGKVVFAAGIDSARPGLSGVFMQKTNATTKNELLLVATDGYRLSLKKTAVEKTPKTKNQETAIIVPARVLKELLALPGEKTEMYVTKENNQVLFFQEGAALIGRLIEAKFPAYEKIIPSDFATKVFFDREELFAAVKTSAIFARESTNIIKFSVQKNKIVVSANAPSVGENSVDVDAKVEGEENEIAFNARYLLDLFANVDEEQMVFEMTGPLNPGVFKINGDASFLHIIMPIRVQG